MVKEKQNLTKTLVESLTYDPEGPAVQYEWDAKVAGFGVRLYPSGGKSYVIGLRLPGETQMSFPVIDRIKDGWPSPETARKKAKRMLADKESPTKAKRDAKAEKAKQRLEQKCIGFAQVAFADNEYGWAATKGSDIGCNVLISCAADVALYTTATAGKLDDTSTSQTKIDGVVAVTAEGGSGTDSVEVIATHPKSTTF